MDLNQQFGRVMVRVPTFPTARTLDVLELDQVFASSLSQLLCGGREKELRLVYLSGSP